METLEKAHDRIQSIAEKIREETLAPAKAEAAEIVHNAKKEAEKIKDAARKEAEKQLHDVKKRLEEEKQIFASSLEQSAKQAVEFLKQKIEKALFNPALDKWLSSQLSHPEMNARLIDAVVKALDKEGTKANLQVLIPKSVNAEEVMSHLTKDVAERLKNGSVDIADIPGGVQVRLEGKHMMIDLSIATLKEIMTSFIRKDFRKFFFSNS